MRLTCKRRADGRTGSRTRLAVLAALAVWLTVAACSGGEDGPEAASPGEIDSPETLSAEVAALYDVDIDFEMQLQDEIAACMRGEGFDYVPYVDPSVTEPVAETSSPAVDSLEDALRGSGEEQNPNELMVAQLRETDPEAAEAFQLALWGTDDNLSVETPENGVDSLDLSQEALGCWNYTAVTLKGGKSRLEFTYTVFELNERLDELVRADPRYIAAEQEVGECMSAGGSAALIEDFEEEFTQLEMLEILDMEADEVDAEFDRVRATESKIIELERSCEAELGLDALRTELSNTYFEQAAEG